ncbi:MAG: hypothetical protein Q4B37_04020 [Eubacteriales bacterium]|nr:hypothetical protein [Eubacteriales bacterium]
MKNKKVLAMLVMTVALSGVLTACGFGGDKPEDQVVVEATPTPEPTEAPKPTATPAPADGQNTTYTSKDKSIAIKLPDATWANKSDEEDLVSFESPDQGKIVITHGKGEEDMSSAVIPSTEDMANSLEKAAGLEPRTDYEIRSYSASDVNGVNVYSYNVKYNNTEKTDGIAWAVKRVYANDGEFYSIEASIKKDDEKLLKKAEDSVASFQILGDSSLKSAAPKQSEDKKADASAEGQNTDGAASDGTGSEAGTSDGSSSGTTNSGGFTDAQLSDTSQTRTIYRNSDGQPIVIFADANGNWVDGDGNSYRFANDEDVYDQNDVDYYYHGEAADVYYMPVQ